MKKVLIFCAFFAFISCNNDDLITFDDLVTIIRVPGAPRLIADGESKIRGEIEFQRKADVNDISAKILELNNITFENSTATEMILTPEVLPNGRLRAEFTLVSTTKPGGLSFEINVNQYRKIFKLEAGISTPAKVSLSKSINSVQNNFLGEVTLEGTLTNDENNKVSQGAKVRFSDFLSDGSPAQGVYRSEALLSNSYSKVSVIYSPGQINPGQFVTIIVEVIDENNELVGISDSTEIYVYE